jgi:hypothetical protein
MLPLAWLFAGEYMTSSSIVARSPHAVSRVVDGEAVIVEPKNGLVNVVNQVGSRIWELLDGQRSVSELTRIVSKEFDADYETILKDALDFLSDLESKGLVHNSQTECEDKEEDKLATD